MALDRAGNVGIGIVLDKRTQATFERDFRAVVGRTATDVERAAAANFGGATTGLQGIGGAARGAGKELQGMAKISAALDSRLAGLGLTGKDLSVLLGAGLAGSAAFAIRSLVELSAASVQAAADLGEARNLVQVTFDEAAGTVEEFASQTARTLGISERQALKTAGTFGALARGVNLPQEAAAQLSIVLTQLSADISSLRNVAQEDVLVALRAGLVGEFEPLRRLGVNLSQARLQAIAAANGIAEFGEELDPTQKQLAILAGVLEQTTDAQGDFARTIDEFPNQMRLASAAADELKVGLGEILLPSITETVRGFNTLLQLLEGTGGAVADVRDKFGPVERLKEVGVGIAESFGVAEESAESFADKADSVVGRLLGSRGPLGAFSAALELVGITLNSGEEEFEGYEEAVAIWGEEVIKAAKEAGNLDQVIQELSASAQAAQNVFRQALASFNANLDTFSPKFGDDFREEASKGASSLNQMADAQRSLDRARIDGAKRVADAERDLAEVLEANAERIEDAEFKLREQRIQDARDIRDAKERLADVIESSNQRIRDAEERAAEAERNRADAILEAQLDAEQARLRGDDIAENAANREIARLKREERANKEREEVEKARLESEKEISRARRDLAETEADSRRQMAEALEEFIELQEENARREEDAERRIVEAREARDRAIEDALRSLERAGSKAAKSTKTTMASIGKAFTDNTTDLNRFFDSLGAIENRLRDALPDVPDDIKEAFLANLKELGPESVAALEEIAKSSPQALSGLVAGFQEQIKAAKRGIDFEFDKYPDNFEGKLGQPLTSAVEKAFKPLLAQFDSLADKGGQSARELAFQLQAPGGPIDAFTTLATAAGIHLTDVQKHLLETAAATKDPQLAFAAFDALLADIQRNRSHIDIKVREQGIAGILNDLEVLTNRQYRVEVEAGFTVSAEGDELVAAAGDGTSIGIVGLKSKQRGGPVFAGHPYFVGEEGPELVVPRTAGTVVPTPRVVEALERIAGFGGSGGVVQNIHVTQVANDPDATAFAVAARMAREAQR